MCKHYVFHFSAFIDGLHFEDDMIIHMGSRVKLALGAIPTNFLPDKCKPTKVMLFTTLLFSIDNSLIFTHTL